MQRRPQGRRVRKINSSILQDAEKISSHSRSCSIFSMSLYLCAPASKSLGNWARINHVGMLP
jgi:hypothetical protein